MLEEFSASLIFPGLKKLMAEKSQNRFRESDPVGSAIVADLLSRQDEVLQRLDELNLRVEAAIKSINDARQRDSEAEPASLSAKAA